MGSDRGKHLRNIAIVLALALAVWLLPGGGQASATISNLLGIAFIAGILFFGYRIYMERRDVLFGLEERPPDEELVAALNALARVDGMEAAR